MTYADDTDQTQEISQHIVINRDKSVYVPEIIRKSIVYRDHNVECLTFDCPRYWSGIDISELNIYVNYIAEGQKKKKEDPGSFLCENVVVDKDNTDIFHFDWRITSNASEFPDKLIFLVCAKSVDSEGNEDVHWNSHLCKDLEVQEGLEASDSIVNKYPDVIESILSKLGKQIELRNSGTAIQYRNAGENTWIDLVQLEDIKGDAAVIIESNFKGSDTTANIIAKTGETGDKWYSTDEGVYYMLSTSGEWINCGSGENLKKIEDEIDALKSDKVNLPKDLDGNILYGINGQVLITNGDGTTLWANIGTSGSGDSGTGDGTTTETIEGGIVYAPYRWNKIDGSTIGWISGTNISLETYLSNRRTDIAFFDMPYLFNMQEDGNVLGDIFNALAGRSNYVAMHYNALKPAKYHYYIPVSMASGGVNNITCKIIKCDYNNIEDFFNAIINDGYSDYTVSDISPITVATETETSWNDGGYNYGLAQYSFVVECGKYGFLTAISLLSCPTADNIETNEMFKFYHLAMNTIIDDPLTYTDTETIEFGTITVENGSSSGGSSGDGTSGNTSTSKSSYPMNTYGKTVVIGGDSGTSYGGSVISDYIKKYCGSTVSVRSVAGSKFTGTESGGGIWFRNQYHDVGYPDVVCLCWGGNFDSGGVGDIKSDYGADGTTPTTTLGALRYIVEDIRTISPETIILGWIPYQMNLDNSWESRKVVYDQIREGYKLLAIPIIDAFYEAGIVPRDMMPFDEGGIGGDSGHPSDYGFIRIAKLIANTIIRYA